MVAEINITPQIRRDLALLAAARPFGMGRRGAGYQSEAGRITLFHANELCRAGLAWLDNRSATLKIGSAGAAIVDAGPPPHAPIAAIPATIRRFAADETRAAFPHLGSKGRRPLRLVLARAIARWEGRAGKSGGTGA